MAAVRIAAVVPTLGVSPYLERCLAALRADGGDGLEIVVVHQGPEELARSVAAAERWADRLLTLPQPAGFAAATNLGIAATDAELVATVNDDAVVESGWSAALAAALAAEPRAAAAQGVNLMLDDPRRVDGWGLAWNRWWQAVQLGHGEAAPGRENAKSGAPRAVFGVSATAALYRRSALAAVAAGAVGPGADAADAAAEPPAVAGGPAAQGAPPEVFDSRLGSYYEDADLAGRLRAAGWTALTVPAACAFHAGSATADGPRAGGRRPAAVYGNRWLVAARLLGRRFPLAAPRMAARDLADLARALAAGDVATVRGIGAGWLRALRHLPAYVRLGPPAVPLAELIRLRAG